jgi:hypothetical protein
VVIKNTIFWDITPCSPLSVNRRFGGTYRLHLQSYACHLLLLWFLARYFFEPEDRGDIFLRNVSWNSTDYTALYPRTWYSSILEKFTELFNNLNFQRNNTAVTEHKGSNPTNRKVCHWHELSQFYLHPILTINFGRIRLNDVLPTPFRSSNWTFSKMVSPPQSCIHPPPPLCPARHSLSEFSIATMLGESFCLLEYNAV